MGEQAPEALAVLCGVGVAPADSGGQHHGHLHRAAGLEVDLRHVVVDLVEADAHEVREHQLGDGSHPFGRSTDGEPDERGLGDRRVDDALRPELLQQPAGGSEDPPVRPDILTQVEDLGIHGHLGGDALGHRLGGRQPAGDRRRCDGGLGGGHDRASSALESVNT